MTSLSDNLPRRPAPLVWCGCRIAEIGGAPDVIVFPEGVARVDVERAKGRFPHAVVVGAVPEAGRMTGFLWSGGENLIDYRKMGFDGRSKGGTSPGRAPVARVGDLALGVVICMDIQNGDFTRWVLGELLASAAPYKLLCIVGDMDLNWSFDHSAPFMSRGEIHVALSNNVLTYPDSRTRSFITDRRGRMGVVQVDKEPISLRLQHPNAD